uniref:Mitochondrial ribosomal protein S11 n=1 Tax=Vombatus ursinus TaxID=29139 RepID=A0A4X2M8L2_VOMUR
MHALRTAGLRLLPLRTWAHTLGAWDDAPGGALHTGSRRPQGAVEKSEVETEAEPGATQKPSRFSIFPPIPGQESSLTWEGKKYEEIPVAHIKATYSNTHIQVVSSRNVRAGTEYVSLAESYRNLLTVDDQELAINSE